MKKDWLSCKHKKRTRFEGLDPNVPSYNDVTIDPLVIGLEEDVSDPALALERAARNRLNFLITPLLFTGLNGELNALNELSIPFEAWNAHMVARLTAGGALRQLEREYSFATHLGLQAAVLDCTQRAIPQSHTSSDEMWDMVISRTANNVGSLMNRFPITAPNLWLRMDIGSHVEDQDGSTACGSWKRWNKIRFLTNHHPRLFLILEVLSSSSPLNIESLLERWTGEPVKAIILPYKYLTLDEPTSQHCLVKRKDVYPLLSWCVRFGVSLVLSSHGLPPGQSIRSIAKQLEELSYNLEHMTLPSCSEIDLQEKFNRNYRDSLRAPLDPLCDNLDSETYRVMEQDPVKYASYQKAIIRAVKDRCEEGENRSIRVVVIGAGRGPLVRSVITARKRLKELGMNNSVEIIILEKNPNAVLLLRNRFAGVKRLSVVEGDARLVARQVIDEASVDIILSELLGSWGDNEAAPEILGEVQWMLKSEGVMIPQSYTSFIAPITSSKLWNAARALDCKRGLHRPYVVQMHSFLSLAPAQPLFQFHHPERENEGKGTDSDGRYHATATFYMEKESLVHGFAGYFQCRLYEEIELSTVPPHPSKGMFSWFPIFLPLSSPQLIARERTLSLQVIRCVEKHAMWYEWAVTSPISTKLHNLQGDSFLVKL